MSLQSFANQRRQPAIGGGTSMIADFVAGEPTLPTAVPIIEKKPSKLKTAWNANMRIIFMTQEPVSAGLFVDILNQKLNTELIG